MSDGRVVFDITGNSSPIEAALNAATSTISRQTAKWTVLGQTAMNGLVGAVKAGMNGIKALWDNAFEYNAQMETYEVNFKTLLGSAEAAQKQVAALKMYAAATPFAMSDLADATQTLLSFGLSSEESAAALSRLGDISLGDANKLQSLTLAFGQVSSAGKLAGQDLLQMINAGFNPLKAIAEETGAAYADLKAVMSGEKTSEDFALRLEEARQEVLMLGEGASLSAKMLNQIGEDGMISADMVSRAMQLATSEGGAFYKALESASQTAKGQLATIDDGWDMLVGNLGKGGFDYLSLTLFPKVIEWLDKLNAAYEKNGFAGLKGAAGGIFDEIGQLALNTGSGIIAQLYSGITGDTKSGEEIKAYLSGLWTDSTASLNTFIDGAKGMLGTIWTSLTGQEATTKNIITTIGGLFSAGVTAANDLLSVAGTFMTDISAAIGDDTLGTGGKIAAIFTAGKSAMQDLINAAADFGVNFYNALTGKNLSSEDFKAEVAKWFGTDGDTYVDHLTQTQEAEAAARTPSGNRGRYAALDEDTQDELLNYAYMAIQKGTQNGLLTKYRWDFSEQFLESGMFQQFQSDLSDALNAGEITIEDIEAWFEDAQGQLQDQLDELNLSVNVSAALSSFTMGMATSVLAALSGQTHAAGGLFTSATRFLGADGMHTFGESGTEALLPLDTLWRKMGFTFDQAFQQNLGALQYSVMPQLPAAAPSAAVDEDSLAEIIAEAVREAVSGLTVEMDKRTVGRIIKPEISRQIADDVNNRRWTS